MVNIEITRNSHNNGIFKRVIKVVFFLALVFLTLLSCNRKSPSSKRNISFHSNTNTPDSSSGFNDTPDKDYLIPKKKYDTFVHGMLLTKNSSNVEVEKKNLDPLCNFVVNALKRAAFVKQPCNSEGDKTPIELFLSKYLGEESILDGERLRSVGSLTVRNNLKGIITNKRILTTEWSKLKKDTKREKIYLVIQKVRAIVAECDKVHEYNLTSFNRKFKIKKVEHRENDIKKVEHRENDSELSEGSSEELFNEGEGDGSTQKNSQNLTLY